MGEFQDLIKRGIVSERFAQEVEHRLFRRSRILILVDGFIQVWPNPGPETGQEFGFISEAFGISTAIATLRAFRSGFSSFAVTVATRNGGSPGPGFDLAGFRFSDSALADYDQVWLFGINPGNDFANSTNPADDVQIEGPLGIALSEQELAALAKWMDAGGGVFAAGDHHFLGASMCHKVPRVATMRRWTITDGVPTIGYATRLDTNRPATPAQASGQEIIPIVAEEDFVPQRTYWVAYSQSPFGPLARPHPLLCHPTLGPIDILPDHPHEGHCHDFASASWQSAKRDLGFTFSGYSNDHYPTVSGKRPLPEVVSWGETLASPPLQFEKQGQPYRRFPQIAAYDGQSIGLGRVVVDSTWHHWFDMNLHGLEKYAQLTGNRRDIDRILRYYVNVGIYLATPAWRAGQLYGWLKAEQFGYFGQLEAVITAPAAELGRIAMPHLKRQFGSCWVLEFVFDQISEVDAELATQFRTKLRAPGLERASLALEDVEVAVIGEIVRALYSDMEDVRKQLADSGQVDQSPVIEVIDELVRRGTLEGVKAAFASHQKGLERSRQELLAIGEVATAKTASEGQIDSRK